MSLHGVVEVRCENCAQWLPTMVTVDSGELVDAETLALAELICPHCQNFTGCSHGNMRLRFPDTEDS